MSKKSTIKNYPYRPIQINTIPPQNAREATMKDFTKKKTLTTKEGQRYFELICEEGTHKSAMTKVNRRFLKEFGYENTPAALTRLNSIARPYKPHSDRCKPELKKAYMAWISGLKLRLYDQRTRKKIMLDDGILSTGPKAFKALRKKLDITKENTLGELTELVKVLLEQGDPHEQPKPDFDSKYHQDDPEEIDGTDFDAETERFIEEDEEAETKTETEADNEKSI